VRAGSEGWLAEGGCVAVSAGMAVQLLGVPGADDEAAGYLEVALLEGGGQGLIPARWGAHVYVKRSTRNEFALVECSKYNRSGD
jgi:hypothetical protein